MNDEEFEKTLSHYFDRPAPPEFLRVLLASETALDNGNSAEGQVDAAPTKGQTSGDTPVPAEAVRKAALADPMLPAFEGYEAVQEVRRGGMGVVYKARNILTRRIEALKVMNPGLAAVPEMRERFLREIQTLANLKHENIVTALGAGYVG